MDNSKSVSVNWMVVAIIFLIVGVILGSFLTGMKSPKNSQQGASLDSEYANKSLNQEMITITIPKKNSYTNEEILNLAAQLRISYDEGQDKPVWLCRFLGGVYFPHVGGGGSCIFFNSRVSANGGMVFEEVVVDGVPFSKLSSEEIDRLAEKYGFSSDPNAKPGWFCRLWGGTYMQFTDGSTGCYFSSW